MSWKDSLTPAQAHALRTITCPYCSKAIVMLRGARGRKVAVIATNVLANDFDFDARRHQNHFVNCEARKATQ